MSALPHTAPPSPGCHVHVAPPAAAGAPLPGEASLGVALRDGVSVVRHLAQRQPLRVLVPRSHDGEPLTAIPCNLSGGLLGGDRLALDVDVGEGASLAVIGQSAERVYRSLGADSVVEQTARVRAGAVLEWLPQGTILFEGGRLRRRTSFTLDAGARLLAAEIVVLGRVAMGESPRRGLLHDEWHLRVGGRLRFADLVHVEGDDHPAPGDLAASIEHPAILGGARAFATAIYAGPDAASLVDEARAVCCIATTPDDGTAPAVAGAIDADPDEVRAGVSLARDGVLLVRLLGRDPARVRRLLGELLASLRSRALGRPARLPGIWSF